MHGRSDEKDKERSSQHSCFRFKYSRNDRNKFIKIIHLLLYKQFTVSRGRISKALQPLNIHKTFQVRDWYFSLQIVQYTVFEHSLPLDSIQFTGISGTNTGTKCIWISRLIKTCIERLHSFVTLNSRCSRVRSIYVYQVGKRYVELNQNYEISCRSANHL